MQQIPASSVKKWHDYRTIKAIASVSAICPYCNDRVIFSVGSPQEDITRDSISGSSNCPGCNRLVHFWSIKKPHDADGNAPASPVDYFMYPGSQNGYPHPSLPETVPVALQRSLISTIDSLNAKNFPATAVGARRTLEGIFKYLVADEKRGKNLFQLIDEVKNSHDLAAPLESLSHAIRSGGNLGAHFDDENEPTEPMARKMVELLDYLISFLYVLPAQITELEKALGKE